MARKFGKKNTISENPLEYAYGLFGEGGSGKTTLAKDFCEKLGGDECYLHLNIGDESGVDAISDIVSEDVETWDKFVEIVDDIVENKTTDWETLKMVIVDSIDELYKLADGEALRLYNVIAAQKNKEKAESLNASWGGFSRGEDRSIDLVLEQLRRLKDVGVRPFIIGHTKVKDIVDPMSQGSYTQITGDLNQKYLNAIYNKIDICAMLSIDRTIVKESTGRVDVVKHKEISVNKVKGEVRRITFRDDNYAVNSKSRFADITSSIPYDVDKFIEVIEEAIRKERGKSKLSSKEIKANEEASAKKKIEASKNAKLNHVDVTRNAEIIDQIKTLFMAASEDKQNDVKVEMGKLGIKSFMKADNESTPTLKLESLLQFLSV